MQTSKPKDTARRDASPTASFAHMMAAPAAYADSLAARGTAYAEILASVSTLRQPAKPGRLIRFQDFVEALKPTDWLIRDIVPRSAAYTLTAHAGTGKTALAVLMAICIAAGIPFAGRAVRRGRVLYLAGENPEDVRARMFATALALGVPPASLNGWLDIWPGARRLNTAYGEIKDEIEQRGTTALVIIDTSSEFFSYDDENKNMEAQRHGHDARRFTELSGEPAVLMLSHPTKYADSDGLLPKGGSTLYNTLDGNLTLQKDGPALRLGHMKIRGPAFDPLQFELRPVDLEGKRDTDGRQMATVALVPLTEERMRTRDDARQRMEDKLIIAISERPEGSMAEWANDCELFDQLGKPEKYRVQRTLKQLQAAKIVESFRNKYRLTARGIKEADRLMAGQ